MHILTLHYITLYVVQLESRKDEPIPGKLLQLAIKMYAFKG